MALEQFSDYLSDLNLSLTDFNETNNIQFSYFQPEDIEILNLYLFQNIDFSILDDYTETYLLDGSERPDTLAVKLYDNSEFWWVNLVINNISYYDLPLTENSLKSLAENLFGIENKYSSVDNYYLALKEINDNKKSIKILKKEFLYIALRKLQDFIETIK